ncbi:MAG: hypothetical protein LBD12_05915 [Clostridiales Family XIII bacterium]|jgi:hypothetical protein|nr:hypothetical protein [Clostridiales Family XIII bacterium]
MSDSRQSSPAAGKLRAWLAAGAPEKLILEREDFPEGRIALPELLACCPWQERMRQRWRSFCAWIGCHTPFVGWKFFWYRHAGVRIGENVRIAPGVIIDFLFPHLITLEDGAVLGLGAIIVCHVYTPDRVVLAQTAVRKRGWIREQAILAVAEIGEGGVLAPCGYTVNPIPAGYIGIGVPAVIRPRNAIESGEGRYD